jgi:recombination protein RecT
MSRTEALADKLATTPTSETGNGTVAVRQPDRAVSLLDSMRAEFEKCLPDVLPIEMFMRVALTGFRKNADLAACSRPSLLGALLDCARLGLAPCTEQASLVPFKGQVTLIVGYEGYVQLMYRSGQVEQVVAELVYEADEWEYSLGDGGRFFHRPNILAENRGKVLFAYAYATLSGGGRTRVAIVTRREAERLQKDYGRGKATSPWNTNFEAMWLKSALRRVQKFAPKSSELRRALVVDGSTFDAAGVVAPEIVEGEVVEPKADTATETAVQTQVSEDDPWDGIEVAKPASGAA